MTFSRNSVFAAVLFFAWQLSAQQAPKPGASIPVQGNATAQTNILLYWTAARRAAAIPRDVLVDPAQFTPTASPVVPRAGGGGKAGAPPVINPLGAALNEADLNLGSVAQQIAESDPDGQAERAMEVRKEHAYSLAATSEKSIIIDDTGFTYAYPFSRSNVLTQLYRNATRKYPYTTVGKLFFTLNGLNYVCSASVVRPHLLLTARHCVFDYVDPSGGSFATNMVFDPGYLNGANTNLGGGWVARRMATWVSNAPGYDYDIGFVQLFDDDLRGCNASLGGTPIESYTGYLGYWYGNASGNFASYGPSGSGCSFGDYSKRQWSEFGYPHAPPFDGKRMVQSDSSTGALDFLGATNTVEVGNDMSGGSSGGPWILCFTPGLSGARNYANGLNSYRWISPNHASAMNSPQFHDYNFNQLLIFAQGLSCP